MSTAAQPQATAAAESAAKTVGRGVMFIGFAKVYFMGAGWLQRYLLNNILSAASLGDFATVNSFVSTINNTVVQGTIQGVSKPTAEDDTRAGAVQRAGLRLQAGLGLLLALVVLAGAPMLAAFWKAPRLATYFRIAALIPLLYAVYAVFVGSANGLRRFSTQAGFDVTFSTMKTVLLVAFAYVWSVTGAFVGFVGAAALILVIAARAMRLPATGEPFPIRRIASFMGAVVAYTALLNLALNSDLLLLRKFALFAPGVDAITAATVAGNYEALRTLAILPYQFLLVVTFVIFPMVSRATFAADREATRAYVSQTMRYALIIAGFLGIVLAARPSALFGVLYKAELRGGAPALPILVAGQCCLALLSVACSILNAAGRTRAPLFLMTMTLAIGAGGIALFVPHAAPGTPMLITAATATAVATATGLLAALIALRARLGGMPPVATMARVGAALAGAFIAARLVPGQGKVVGLAVMALAGIAYLAILIVTREFGPEDRAKFAKVFKR